MPNERPGRRAGIGRRRIGKGGRRKSRHRGRGTAIDTAAMDILQKRHSRSRSTPLKPARSTGRQGNGSGRGMAGQGRNGMGTGARRSQMPRQRRQGGGGY
jgi:hypothetical protein